MATMTTMTSGTKRSLNEISDTTTATNTNSTESDDAKYIELPFFGEHTRAVSAVAFAPSIAHNNSTMKKDTLALCASASADGTVRLWDIKKSDVDNVTLNNVNTVNGSGSKSVQVGGGSGRIMTPVVTLEGHSRGVNDVCWSPTTPEIIATASDDKTLRLFDVTRSSSGSILDSSLSPTASNPNNNASSPVHGTSNSSGNGQTIQGDTLVEFKGHSNFCFSVKFSPHGNLLVSGSFDETVKIWDVRNGECVATLPAHSDPVTGVDFNRDGTCIVSSSHDGLIRIWDVATGECLKTIYAEGNPPVTSVKYSPNGKYVLSGTLDGKLRLWDVTGKFASSIDADGSSLGSRMSAGGGFGASSTQGRGGQCTKTYSGHVNSKYCIFSAFNVANPKHQSIVTGSEDGNVYLYDLQTRVVKQVLENAHSDACLAVAAHDKLELLATGGMSNDKTVRFWIPSDSR